MAGSMYLAGLGRHGGGGGGGRGGGGGGGMRPSGGGAYRGGRGRRGFRGGGSVIYGGPDWVYGTDMCYDVYGNITWCPPFPFPVDGMGATLEEQKAVEAKVLPWVGLGLLALVGAAVYNGWKAGSK